jgi:hypothetical protein
MGAAARQGARTVSGQAFTDQPGAQPEPERGFFNSLGYGLGYSAPTLAAGLAGGAAGSTIGAAGGPVGAGGGGLIGAGLGVGAMSLAQDLAPAYDAARQNGMDHDAAVTYALEHGTATGVISGATALIPAPVRSVIGRILLAGFVTQPVAGAAVRVGVPAVMGEPLPTTQQLIEGYGQDVATGLGFAGAHAVYSHATAPTPRPPPGPEATAAATRALSPAGVESPTERVGAPQPPPVVPGQEQAAAAAAAAPPPIAREAPPAEPAPTAAPTVATATTAGQEQAPVEAGAVEPPAATGERAPAQTTPSPLSAPEVPSAPPEARPMEPGVDRSATPTGGPTGEAAVGEPAAPRLEPTGVPEPSGGAGDQGARAPGVAGEPAAVEPTARATPETGAPAVASGEAPTPGARPGEPAPAVEPTLAEQRAHQQGLSEEISGLQRQLSAARGQISRAQNAGVDPPAGAVERRAAISARIQELEKEYSALGESIRNQPSEAAAPTREPAAAPTARPPEAYLKLDPNISAADYARRMSELQANKPRPIDKLWRNPETAPPEQVEAARQALRDWNREYRLVSKNQKLALERDNAAYRAQQAAPGGEPTAPPEEPVTGQQTPEMSRASEGLTTEPDHVVPNQFVAKDAQGEVVGKGPTPELALADARGEAPATGPERAGPERAGPGTTEEAPAPGPTEPPAPEKPATTGVPQLDRLLAERERLRAEAAMSQSPVRQRYLQRQMDKLRQQAEKLAASQGVENPLADTTAGAGVEERRAGRKLPFSGPPEVGKPKDFLDYKFNDGTSVFRSVFDEAGIDHNRAVNMPIHEQVGILTRHMINKFGFQSVKVETSGGTGRVDQKIARDAMLDATRAITDGMASLGLPHKAASLNGRLKLVYDPEGKVNYYGAYEPGSGTIRIMGGANSFGHEWTHAVDHLLSERLTGNPTQMNKLLSQYTRDGNLVVTDKVQAAFAKVINTLFYDQGALAAKRLMLEPLAAKTDRNGKPTASALEAQRQLAKLEAGGSQLHIAMSEFRKASGDVQPGNRGYWQSAWEMLARAHEAYLAETMQNAGVDPRGFVMPDDAYRNMVDRQLQLAYPKDTAAIFKAFDELHQALRNEQVLSGGEPAGEFSNLGISDPRYWSVTAPYLAGTAEGAAMKRENNRYSNMTKILYDKSRPAPGDNTFKRGLADEMASAVFSLKGLIERVIKRAPDAAKQPAQAILDRLAPAPGTGRYTGRTFEEAHRFYGRDWGRRFGAIMKDAGLDPNTMSPEQGEMLRHFLTTSDIAYPIDPLDPSAGYKAIPQDIQKAGGRMRFLLDEIWKALHDAGIDVGYAKSGYYPRLYDLAKISADPQGFRRNAAALHNLIFDQNVGTPGDDPAKLLEQWTGLSKEDRQMADPGLAANMAELQKNLRQQAAIEQNPNPTPAETAQLAQLKQQAEALAQANHDDLRGHVSTLAANNWYGRLARGGIHDFDGTGPSGSYIKARVLPPETDQIMRDYMHTQPADALPHYFQGAARRLAFAERFGANGEDLNKLLNAAVQGGMRIEDVRRLENLVDMALGRDHARGNAPLMRLSNMIHAVGSLALMPRAMWSGLSEPMNAALVTGKASVGFKIFAQQFGQLMRRANAQDWTEIAHFLNVTTSAMHDSIMLSRMGADYADQPALNRLMTQYYRVTGLTQLTNSQRVGGVAGSNWFLAKLARDFKSNDAGARENAGRWMGELGLPKRIHDDFTQWMLDLNGGKPSLDQLKNDPMGSAYGLAVGRLVDRIIQDPYKIDRAAGSNIPVVGLAFQLMSFNYSFQHNVLNPLWDTIEHSYGQAKLASEARGAGPVGARIRGYTAAGGSMMHAAAMVGTVLGTGLLVNAVRQAIFAPDQWAKHEADDDVASWLLDLTFQRSGLNGTLDPIIQLYSHLRYDSDISALLEGASVNWLAKNAQDIIQPLVRTNDSPNTNTIYYNQARGMFNLIGVPAAAIGLTMMGGVGGPLAKLAAGGVLQLGTSPYAVGQYAETAAGGPTGTKAAPQPKPGQLPSLPGLPALPDLPKLPQPGETAATGDSGATLPWGLLDDVAIPAWRYGQSVASKVPGPIKALAAAGALGYAVNDYFGKTAPYRETTARQQ